jgi:hypothetical protein
MTLTVPKTVGAVVLGPPSDALNVTKLVAFVVYDTTAGGSAAAPKVRKKVSVKGRFIYEAE